PEGARVDLQLDQVPHRFQSIAEEETCPLDGAEKIADHRKATALHAREENGRATRLVDAPVDVRGFQVRIDLRIDANQLPAPLEISDAGTKRWISHPEKILAARRIDNMATTLCGFAGPLTKPRPNVCHAFAGPVHA